jgi:hypothetical protein
MAEEKDPDMERLAQFAVSLRPHFSDFCLIVRTKDGSRAWVETNEDWSLGACTRHITMIKDKSLIGTIEDNAQDKGE